MKITEGAPPFPEKTDRSFIDYRHWYAIQTIAGCEKKLVSLLQVLLKETLFYLPTRKVIHQLKGIQHILNLPLFPGYIFVYRRISQSLEALDKANSQILFKPVKADGKYLKADKDEMKFFFEMTGEDGIIELSKGILMENQEVEIIHGPLKRLKGRILFINRRKNKAKVRMELMNRKVDVSLGLEIVSRTPQGPIPARGRVHAQCPGKPLSEKRPCQHRLRH